MNNTNTLVSGDNRGYASYAVERKFNGHGTRPGEGEFVAVCHIVMAYAVMAHTVMALYSYGRARRCAT